MAFVPTQLEPLEVCQHCGRPPEDCRCAEDEEDEELARLQVCHDMYKRWASEQFWSQGYNNQE